MFEAKPVHFHRSAFSFVHLRRSPDCPSLKKLSSLSESKVANTYVDKGSSNVAHKSFQLLLQNIFTSNFRRYLNIQKATVFEKFSNPWKRCLWVRANNLQIMFTIQVLNPRSKQSSVETSFRSKQTLEKNQSWSKSVRATKIKSWVKVCDQKDVDLHQTLLEWNARRNLLETKIKRKSWRHQSVARNLDQTLDLQPNRRKNLVCKVPLLALPWDW